MTLQIDHEALYPNLPEVTARHGSYSRLKPAQKLFVDAYLSQMGNSARAAGKAIVDVIAKFPKIDNSDRANMMLRNSDVRAAIRERAHAIAAKFDVDANRTMKEVAQIAFSNMSNYLHITENGEPYIDLSQCTFDQMAAISEVTVEDFKEGRGEDARDVRRVKIKLHDKLNALDKIMRHLSLFAPDKVEVQVRSENVNVNMTAQEAAELYQARLRNG